MLTIGLPSKRARAYVLLWSNPVQIHNAYYQAATAWDEKSDNWSYHVPTLPHPQWRIQDFCQRMRSFPFSLSSFSFDLFSLPFPFHTPSLSFPSPYPTPFPSPNTARGIWGSAVCSPSGSGQSPAAKRNLVHSTVESGIFRSAFMPLD